MDAERNGLSRGLVTGDTLNVDHVLETVDGGDLALTALVGTTDNGDLVVLADGDAADLLDMLDFWYILASAALLTNVVLLTELLGEGSAHDNAALGGGGLEVSSAALAAGVVDG